MEFLRRSALCVAAITAAGLPLGEALRVGQDREGAQELAPPNAVRKPPPGLPPGMPPPGMPPQGGGGGGGGGGGDGDGDGGGGAGEDELMAARDLARYHAVRGGDMFITYRLVNGGDGAATWMREDTGKNVRKENHPVMKVTYKGSQEGFEAADHNFDANITGMNFGYSVNFRDIHLSGIGTGNHFYKKFALNKLGESDKSDSQFTVTMDTPHFGTGAKVWKVYKGYCKKMLFGMLVDCHGNREASTTPMRQVYCSGDYNDKESYWSPGNPQSCTWSPYDRFGEATLESSLMFASIFENGPDDVKVDRNHDADGKVSTEETYMFLAIITALKEAFKVGGSGN